MSNANVDAVHPVYEAFGAVGIDTILGLLGEDVDFASVLHRGSADTALVAERLSS